jgi:hypothetical protein
VTEPPEPPPAVVAFCPYCGEPLGSFFGSRLADDTRCCDRCGECFRITRVNDYGSN